MSVNNRKYLTSTGILLKQLNEESHQQHQQQQQQPHQAQMYQQQNYHPQNGPLMGQYHGSYTNLPSYSTGHMTNQYTPQAFPQASMAAAAALLNKLAIPNQYQQSGVPDIMMLPGSTSQQRWQQKTKPSHSYSKQQQTKHKKSTSSLNSSSSTTSLAAASSSSSSSSVTELPETFGLPSNKISKTNHSKYTPSLQTTNESSKNDVIIEEPLKSDQVVKDDIEIISENYPDSTITTTNTTTSNSMMIQTAFHSNNDENFKNYLAKHYNGQLAIASKPQCNFISNFACINQILNESDYYNKLRRRKPYSNVRLNKIYDSDKDEDEEDDDDVNIKPRIKMRKIIVIDDTNEDIHKPWITSDLIKLIKHRNLLQLKINENNIKLEGDTTSSGADADLIKKFRNLRNKVTKLVKKARKDYLAKYIQESKENKKVEKTAELDSDLVKNLAQDPPPPPPQQKAKSPSPESKSTINSNVQSLTQQLNSSTNQTNFLQNQNNLMMSLYNSYFNQYLQQYQHQQQQAQQLATAAASKSDEDSKQKAESDYDILQKQAAYYAQQQRAIQTQLETSLAQSAQQLVQEIATMASNKTNQPFILNQQFNHQQQNHLHLQPQSFTGLLAQTVPAQQHTAQTSNLFNMHYNYNKNMIVS